MPRLELVSCGNLPEGRGASGSVTGVLVDETAVAAGAVLWAVAGRPAATQVARKTAPARSAF